MGMKRVTGHINVTHTCTRWYPTHETERVTRTHADHYSL
jgi:hypothetical protein